MIKQEFITITVHGELLTISQYKGSKLINKHDLDLLYSDTEKTLFNILMKHNEDLPLVISWKDLRFLRKIGIRI